jgi:hypothetical protein
VVPAYRYVSCTNGYSYWVYRCNTSNYNKWIELTSSFSFSSRIFSETFWLKPSSSSNGPSHLCMSWTWDYTRAVNSTEKAQIAVCPPLGKLAATAKLVQARMNGVCVKSNFIRIQSASLIINMTRVQTYYNINHYIVDCCQWIQMTFISCCSLPSS